MSKLYIVLTEDERYWNGEVQVTVNDRDSLTGKDAGICIGNEIEIVLSVPQAVSLFDLLDGWLNKYPIKVAGNVERRVIEAVKETAKDNAAAVRAMNSRPEELARCLYENMKVAGVRFRIAGER